MPPNKKPGPPSRSRAEFKEPAALKRLNKSLDAAHEALTELRKNTGRDVSQGARDLHSNVRTFVSSARRDTGKLTKALQRDFDQAQKQATKATSAPRSRTKAAAASRPKAPRTAAKRRTSKTS